MNIFCERALQISHDRQVANASCAYLLFLNNADHTVPNRLRPFLPEAIKKLHSEKLLNENGEITEKARMLLNI